MVPAEAPLQSYGWSSFPEYLKAPAQRVPWLQVTRVFGECGVPKDSAAGRRHFEQLMESRRSQANDEAFAGIRRGWYLGGEEFRQELLERVTARAGPQHYGSELTESAVAKAEQIVANELGRLGWTPADLASKRKGDPDKVALAMRLRRETTMTLAWIAQRLSMGTRTHLAHLLYWVGRGVPRQKKHITID
jgi:hypothetical protein